VISGQRISTIEGAASFLLNITPTSVVLTQFQSEFTLNVSLDPSASHLRLTFATGLGGTVQTSTNLVDWSNLEQAPAQTVGDQTEVELPIDLAEPQRFYRLYR